MHVVQYAGLEDIMHIMIEMYRSSKNILKRDQLQHPCVQIMLQPRTNLANCHSHGTYYIGVALCFC